METKDFIQYTGTKTVLAQPMTKGEAEKHLGRKVDATAIALGHILKDVRQDARKSVAEGAISVVKMLSGV